MNDTVKTILLVEDDFDIKEALARILEGEGYAVAGAENGVSALRYLRTGGRAALIILDLMMPIMDGWQFRAEQRRDPNFASIPVVVLSAHGNVPEQAVEIGAAGWLRKPIDIDLLIDTVRRHLV